MELKVIKEYLGQDGHLYKVGDVVYASEPLGQFTTSLIENDFVEELTVIDFENWEEKGIKSKLANLIIAPVDYVEGKKKHFTYDEALGVEKNLKNGWRLPTRSEWVLICEEFAQKDGVLNGNTLISNLHLGRNGYVDDGYLRSAGQYGRYWSSRAVSNSNYAYFLTFDNSYVNPSYNSNRYYGFSLRLVKASRSSDD